MSSSSNDDLKREIEAAFGVALSDQQIETGKGRLPNMVQIARLLEGWAGKLGTTGPAQVQEALETADDKATSHDG